MTKEKSISLVSIDEVTFKRLKRREYHLRSNYNIDIKIYDEMRSANNNKCYICNRTEKLVVDHDHLTGKVRGLLCNNCNIMLGHAKDNPETLKNAINYLNTCKEKSYEITRVDKYNVPH